MTKRRVKIKYDPAAILFKYKVSLEKYVGGYFEWITVESGRWVKRWHYHYAVSDRHARIIGKRLLKQEAVIDGKKQRSEAFIEEDNS